jgi:uncharacterized protein
VFDIGDEKRGQHYNRLGNLDCPACGHSRMIKMVDAQQPHIWYESCTACFGRFYDAGEFKDVTDFTLNDLIKRLLAPERKG